MGDLKYDHQRYEEDIFNYIKMFKEPIATGSLCEIFTHIYGTTDFYKALDSLAAKGLIESAPQTIVVETWKVKE